MVDGHEHLVHRAANALQLNEAHAHFVLAEDSKDMANNNFPNLRSSDE
jgi:hypothetical protein